LEFLKGLMGKQGMQVVKAKPVKNVSSILSEGQRGGRVIVFDVMGKSSRARISSSRTNVSVAGKKVKRGELKPGMSCEIAYSGSGSQAKSVTCK